MFFLQKEGVYFHGVFWIGNDVEEGKIAADSFANRDVDSYHEWVLYEFRKQEVIEAYRAVKLW